jgi:hypothetical protein
MNDTDQTTRQFWAALARYRASQAAVIQIMAGNSDDDEPMSAAIEERHLAIIGLMNTPIGVAHQFFHKMEVVEELIAKESIDGISTANYPMMAISSLKRDFVNLDDDGHKALFHLQEKQS